MNMSKLKAAFEAATDEKTAAEIERQIHEADPAEAVTFMAAQQEKTRKFLEKAMPRKDRTMEPIPSREESRKVRKMIAKENAIIEAELRKRNRSE